MTELQATDLHNPETTYYVKTGLNFWSLDKLEMRLCILGNKPICGRWVGRRRSCGEGMCSSSLKFKRQPWLQKLY